jgi:hypothetical protein
MTAGRPPAWEVLVRALIERRPVRVLYHHRERLVCPHVLGWNNGQAKALVYQAAGATGHGPLPAEPRQRWRSMFVEQIENATITDDHWQTADNYSADFNGIDEVEILIGP